VFRSTSRRGCRASQVESTRRWSGSTPNSATPAIERSASPPHPLWREAALYREADGTLVVPDSVGTAPYFRAPGERLGVSPYQRLWPPRRALGGLDPDRVLVGHGTGVFDDAASALVDALAGARRRAPATVATSLTTLARNLYAALRG
jgi:hypothetical protein